MVKREKLQPGSSRWELRTGVPSAALTKNGILDLAAAIAFTIGPGVLTMSAIMFLVTVRKKGG
jgi:hypothetical protein